MARRKISLEDGTCALDIVRNILQQSASTDSDSKTPGGSQALARRHLITAVRYSLEELADQHPGQAVEVRVPPAGAVQILQGTTHRRGTPPAVVETDMQTWIQLVLGHTRWEDAVSAGKVQASGNRTDLSKFFPLEFQNSSASI